jgi:hypothetical protein
VKRAVLLAAIALAGCGGDDAPRLPRAWSNAAARIETAPCAAGRRAADRLRADVIAAINAGRVPADLQEELTSKLNAVAAWQSCADGRRRAGELADWLRR